MVSPKFQLKAYNCPHCNAYAEQHWAQYMSSAYLLTQPGLEGQEIHQRLMHYLSCECSRCKRISFWYGDQMIYPNASTTELPNEDLSEAIKKIYHEARDIVNRSPRGAAALLRLAVQMLCIELGEKGKSINDDIESLVKKGLPIPVQKALDILRVTGNYAVHPGTIDFEDQIENAYSLFGLINFIANHFITGPKTVAAFYETLPEKDRTNIEKRDSTSE